MGDKRSRDRGAETDYREQGEMFEEVHNDSFEEGQHSKHIFDNGWSQPAFKTYFEPVNTGSNLPILALYAQRFPFNTAADTRFKSRSAFAKAGQGKRWRAAVAA